MLVIKKINNNVALCVDDDGRELIAISKGIGFKQTPYVFDDLKQITRTFYNLNEEQIGFLKKISDDAVVVASYIMDYSAKLLGYSFRQNVVFTLADHIDFVIERSVSGSKINFLNKYDIKFSYPKEFEIGIKAVELINSKFNVNIAKDEAIGIAMHIINAETSNIENVDGISIDSLLNDIVKLIEREMNIVIDRESFDYARFVTHLQYLVKRTNDNQLASSDNIDIYKTLKGQYTEISELVLKIKYLIERYCGKSLSDEESVYLILHTNRLCTRIDKRPLR